MRLFRRLWKDEAGFLISTELVLLCTIVVIGLCVGMVSLRNQVLQELVDTGQAVGSISQSYMVAGVLAGGAGNTGVGGHGLGTGRACAGLGWNDGWFYWDLKDFCQDGQVAPYQAAGNVGLAEVPANAPDSPPGGERGVGGWW